MSTTDFAIAYEVYAYLLGHGFPGKASLKLVGDRFRLGSTERNCLFRGAIARETAESRRHKLVCPHSVTGQRLGLDWYNILITVESYLKGVVVLRADDGVLRDAMAAHGSYRPGPVTEQAIEAILEGVAALAPGSLDVLLDSPVAWSARMAADLRERLARVGLPFEVHLDASADFALKSYDGIVASADSVILDCARAVLDLPGFVLARSFGFTAPRLPDLPS
jgi:hypothetical protein